MFAAAVWQQQQRQQKQQQQQQQEHKAFFMITALLTYGLWRKASFPTIQPYVKPLRHTDSSGHTTVQGGAGLKATQYYPAAFGVAVAQMFVRHEDSNFAVLQLEFITGSTLKTCFCRTM